MTYCRRYLISFAEDGQFWGSRSVGLERPTEVLMKSDWNIIKRLHTRYVRIVKVNIVNVRIVVVNGENTVGE